MTGAVPPDALDLFAESPNYEATCTFSGLPPPSINWYHDGNLLSHVPGVTEISATSDAENIIGILTLPSPAVSQSGVYQCVGRNDAGIASTSWAISIRDRGEIDSF